MILKSILAVALAAAFAAPVAAQQSAPEKAVPKNERQAKARDNGFAELDRNKDGYLSRSEARDMPWADRFSELDKDNDERVSQSEFEALRSAASGKTK